MRNSKGVVNARESNGNLEPVPCALLTHSLLSRQRAAAGLEQYERESPSPLATLLLAAQTPLANRSTDY